MNKLLLVVIFSGISFVFAQTSGRSFDTASMSGNMSGARLLAKAYASSNGTDNRLFHRYWMNGNVTLDNGKVVENEFLRYNLMSDELFWLRKKDFSIGVVYKNLVQEFTIFNDSARIADRFVKVRLRGANASDSTDTYLQVLTEGKASLFVQRKAIITDNAANGRKEMNGYYLCVDAQYHSFAPKLSSLCKTLGVDGKRMKSVIQENHLNICNESELIQAIKKYNE